MQVSNHARRRMQQRGISNQLLDAVIANADIERPIGRNCSLFRVHRRTANSLNIDDRLAKLFVIVSDDVVVTVAPLRRGRSGARYRKVR